MSTPGAGHEFPRQEVSWLKRDALLFAYSIGCKADELHFLYELHPNFAVFPTYPIILPFKLTDQEVTDFYARSGGSPIPGVPKFDYRRVVDGQRKLTILKPLPPTSEGKKFELRNKVIGVYDKGKPGTVIETEQTIVDKETGEIYSRTVSSGFFVGQGNWGGPKGPSNANYAPPEGKQPDAVHVVQTTPETAHLYRLNGDYNPLHATPEPGEKMGFGGAIVHGLFSWNSAAHGVLRELGGSDPKNLKEIQARFASPVIPGDKLITEIWRTGSLQDGYEEIRFVTKNVMIDRGTSTSRAVSSFTPKYVRLTYKSSSVSTRFPSLVRANSSVANARATPSSSDNEDPWPLHLRNQKWESLQLNHEGQASNFGTFWLRDNCQCSKCIHPDTRQRTVDTFAIPDDIRIKDLSYEKDGVKVDWSDGHHAYYPFPWLKSHSNKPVSKLEPKSELHFREIKSYVPGRDSTFPTFPYAGIMADDGALRDWLEGIYDWGFAFVQGVPTNPESTEALLKRIAFIRNTHYGGFWDFTADLTFKDTAYTTEFLGAHTDNTYFTDPARLQLFHLLSHTNGDGGASLLVDGFRAASILREESPEDFEVLMSTNHPYHSSGNEDVCVQPAEQAPVLKVHPELQRLYQIRWNNYDRAAKKNWNWEEQVKWYTAARHWDEIIRRKDMEIWTQLEPGTALIFDNWRMLHGRSEFTGKRRMCGGYINNDDFISRYRLLKFGREEVLRNIGNDQWSLDNPNYYI
ncbi:putative trimethyllysine dioxygenase TmlH [Aspergillus vadensis CBS 113365]|uniref:Trimethyllysine dioxygenase n=1 Tax=Aspergillus vadensis (strain CBS 113365 / IMI 142717 / IBT 24658) TaxID=1448311 RepID=A0A319BFH6_ASPVC|nr:trimethyllysine dioxygenase TmlH [Aspergillus vadensis CBS 113365]PYH71495.1 trimethyllysine dioxygenase TmlH [Aspergillus vadensis CBS 113365]